ncbi:MAG TPA: DHHA1 domain-containing protein, partial [Candidatus Omnitrophota bacterium]|nr:DHHA1 domain-containing protein [Candidatus Omnitrophota bacterium]
DKKVLSKEEALKGGAIAFFGEKYEDEVRVVTIGEFSKELCGGTHLHSTGQIGLFKIVSESSIQAGVRRIEAVTGRKALENIAAEERGIQDLAASFHVQVDVLPDALRKLETKLGGLKNALLAGTSGALRRKISDELKKSEDVKGAKLLFQKINGADGELLKVSVEYLKSLSISFAAMISSEAPDKISFVVAASPDLAQKGFNAGKIVKEISAIVQGSGGGRPDFAMGGGKDLEKGPEALSAGQKAIREALATTVKGN